MSKNVCIKDLPKQLDYMTSTLLFDLEFLKIQNGLIFNEMIIEYHGTMDGNTQCSIHVCTVHSCIPSTVW